jgi:hypothetical protein
MRELGLALTASPVGPSDPAHTAGPAGPRRPSAERDGNGVRESTDHGGLPAGNIGGNGM